MFFCSTPINAQQADNSAKSTKTTEQNINQIQCVINKDVNNLSNATSYNVGLRPFATIKIGRINNINSTVALDTATYEIKQVNSDNNIRFTSEFDSENKSVTLSIKTILLDNTKHMVIIKNAKDANGNKIDSDVVFTFMSGDNTPPFIKTNDCFTVNQYGKIIIYFSEPMNEAQMLDKSSYMVATTSGAIYAPLGTNDTVTKLSNKSILIDMSETVDKPNVMISPITDLSGKTLNSSSDNFCLQSVPEERVLIKSANLITKNKVKLTFNSKLATFANSDILLSGTTGTTEDPIRIAYIESITVNDDDTTELVFLLNKDLDTNAEYNGSYILLTTSQNTRSESIFGTRLLPSQCVYLNDKVAPEVITYDHDSNDMTEPVEKVVLSGDILTNDNVYKDTTGTITIFYSEEIPLNCISILTYAVDGYTVTDVSHGNDNSEVVLSIMANADNTPAKTTVTQVYNIQDYNGNLGLSGQTWIVR